MNSQEVKTNYELIKIKAVVQIAALSRSAIYAEMKKGSFPKQRQLTVRSVAWLREEVEAWVASRTRKN